MRVDYAHFYQKPIATRRLMVAVLARMIVSNASLKPKAIIFLVSKFFRFVELEADCLCDSVTE